MVTGETLTIREQEILHSILKEYIETGEPVGSRLISKRRSDNLSPASIRNAMADLADRGFLSQPHTSAGRVPTEKAFRYCIRSLAAGRVPPMEALRIRAELLEADTVERRVERSSHILTELTRKVGIAAALPASGQILEQIELLPLTDGQILMILVTRNHIVHNRVVDLEERIPADELATIRNYINRNFEGWSLKEARQELLRRIDIERAAFDAMTRRLALLYSRGLLELDAAPEVHMEGTGNLVGIDLHLTRETMRELLRALEQKKRVLELLDHLLEETPGELQVRVGLGEVHPAMKELAIIGLAIRGESGLVARIAVLGPMRMQYQRIMGTVLHIGRILETVC